MGDVGVVLRPATKEDLPFLHEMASLFGGDQSASPAIQDWMLPEWDLGFIAVRSGDLAGAGWWRPNTGFTAGGWDPAQRELFLSVREPHEGQGIGSRLLDALIAEARQSSAIRRLAARPRDDRGVQMLEKRSFERRDAPYGPKAASVWVLDLGSSS